MPRIAICQAGTILYDNEQTLRKLEEYAREASAKGAELVLFPEAFIGGYPKWNDFGITMGSRSMEGREDFRRYYESAIVDGGEECKRIEALAIELKLIIVTGAVERSAATLYCSVFVFGGDGQLGKHRKLLPTAMERCVWGQGSGEDVRTFETPVGCLAAAICWENYMPLYRFALYGKGVQLYLAPTVDDRDVWLPTMQTIALEGRCFVISACQFLQAKNYPEDHKMRQQHDDDKVLIRGGSCVIDPLGQVLVAPEFNKEFVKVIDVDLSRIALGKMDLDVNGHYSRPDVFQLHVNDTINGKNVRYSSDS